MNRFDIITISVIFLVIFFFIINYMFNNNFISLHFSKSPSDTPSTITYPLSTPTITYPSSQTNYLSRDTSLIYTTKPIIPTSNQGPFISNSDTSTFIIIPSITKPSTIYDFPFELVSKLPLMSSITKEINNFTDPYIMTLANYKINNTVPIGRLTFYAIITNYRDINDLNKLVISFNVIDQNKLILNDLKSNFSNNLEFRYTLDVKSGDNIIVKEILTSKLNNSIIIESKILIN